jgi:Phosphotransferase enzyme family
VPGSVLFVDGTVKRRAGPWSDAVHALLRHFELVGFDGAPRSLGICDGYEILSYVEGTTAVERAPSGDESVFSLGKLIRDMHDAQRGFGRDADWQRLPGAIGGDEVVCHTDVLGHNVVFRGDVAVGLIDWELAAPGLRLTDVAAAAVWFAPLRAEKHARRYGLPWDRRRERLRALADGYALGLEDRRRLLGHALRMLESWHEAYRVLGSVRRLEPWAERWDNGQGARITQGIAWLAENRHTLERWYA